MPSHAEKAPGPGRSKVSFTTRGSSILAASVAAGVGSVALGETDLLRVAIIIAVICIGNWLLHRSMPLRLRTVHVAQPPEAPIGQSVTVLVKTTLRRALLPASAVCHDRVSPGLRPTGHLAVTGRRLASGITLRFSTAPRIRGVHQAGPLDLTVRDPLGLVTTRHCASEHAEVLGLPRWHPVHPAWLRSTGPMPRFLDSPIDKGMDGDPDVGVREHRAEDGLRRIHWRTSARAGRLMTRLDEPQADRTATVAFESRAQAHRGHSYENTLEVVASVGLALLRAGWDLRIVDSLGERRSPGPAWDAGSLLRFLALAQPESSGQAPQASSSPGPGLLVTTAIPDPGTISASRVLVVEPGGQRLDRSGGVTVIGTGSTVADVLAVAPVAGVGV